MSTLLTSPESGSPKRRNGSFESEVRAAQSAPTIVVSKPTPEIPWHRRTWVIALTGSVLMYAALPPLDLWPLAWIAPLPWLLLVRQRELLGRRPYLTLWAAGFVFWLAAIHWIRLPHPILYVGWVAITFYLAFYIPVFVGLCRVAVHQLKLPLVVAAPVVWFGLELAKGHLITGFTMGSLGHSQVHWLAAIQISDLFGSYAVSALVIFVAACFARMIAWDGAAWHVWPLAPLAAVMAAVLGYGSWQLREPAQKPDYGPRIALIQGSFTPELKSDPAMDEVIHGRYLGLSGTAVVKSWRERLPVDLVVWPETMYRNPLFTFDESFQLPDDLVFPNGRKKTKADFDDSSRLKMAEQSFKLRTPLLTGVMRIHGNSDGRVLNYNSAALVAPDGSLHGYYDKMHLVMFGEYIPFTDVFPWLYDLTPVSGGAEPGKGPAAFTIGNARIAPNICYETTIPHLIRNQVVALREQGAEPDILVNVTNDGWFRGSSELDMHLACGVFRAIECRKPLLIAANTGFSAWIDANGKVVKQAKRFEDDAIIAEPILDHRRSLYLTLGDWPAAICLIFCCGLAVIGRKYEVRSMK